MNQYVIYAIPLFLLVVIFEIISNVYKHKKVYRFEDTITNFSLGLTQQIFEALTKTLFVLLFFWLYEHSLFRIPDTVLSFIIVILASDFLFYWFHRAAHHINFLWAIHGVHHQGNEFNLSLSLRQPLLQKAAMLAFYLIIPFLGFSPALIASAFAFQTIYPFFLHTRLVGKLGILEYFMVTPSHHKVHHGINPLYINKNFGNTFIIWDRLFGTFQSEKEHVVVGTSEPFTSTNPLLANIFFWRQIVTTARQRKGWWHKIKTYFQGPEVLVETDHAEKKEPAPRQPLPAGIKRYVVLQYLLLLTFSIYFLYVHASLSALFKAVLLVFIFWSTYSYSRLMQRKKNVLQQEAARMTFWLLILYLFLFSGKLGLEKYIYATGG